MIFIIALTDVTTVDSSVATTSQALDPSWPVTKAILSSCELASRSMAISKTTLESWCNAMCQFRNWEIALFQVKCYSQPSIFVVATNAAVIGWVLACFLTLAVPNKSWPSPRARVKLARSKPTSIFQKSSVRLRTVRSRFSQNA